MTDRTITLTAAELELVIHALHAVAPSGGGSRPFHLALRLQGENDVETNWERVGRLQMTAHDEIRQAIDDGTLILAR